MVVKAVEALCTVYKDIIPSYKIRENAEEEKEGGKLLSKEVKRVREYEHYILESY